MSLVELLEDVPKPWLNGRVNNLQVDGELSNSGFIATNDLNIGIGGIIEVSGQTNLIVSTGLTTATMNSSFGRVEFWNLPSLGIGQNLNFIITNSASTTNFLGGISYVFPNVPDGNVICTGVTTTPGDNINFSVHNASSTVATAGTWRISFWWMMLGPPIGP